MKAFALDDVFFIGRKLPVDPERIDAFERSKGMALPKGYRETLAALGRSDDTPLDRGLCGRVRVFAPDEIDPHLQKLDEGARRHGQPRYFGKLVARNFIQLFTDDDASKLVPLARSFRSEYLLTLPGLDEIFYLPSPRAGGDVVVAGTDFVSALAHLLKVHDVQIPYFLSTEGVAETRIVDKNEDPDWTSVMWNHCGFDLADDDLWNFFFRDANACVNVVQGTREGVVFTVHAGAPHDALLEKLRALIANPPADE